MSFQYAIYYLFNKTLKVESTSIIVGNSKFSQVTSQPDLEEDAWIEIKCPTKKDPEKTVAAKVLLFGGKFGVYQLTFATSPFFVVAAISLC